MTLRNPRHRLESRPRLENGRLIWKGDFYGDPDYPAIPVALYKKMRRCGWQIFKKDYGSCHDQEPLTFRKDGVMSCLNTKDFTGYKMEPPAWVSALLIPREEVPMHLTTLEELDTYRFGVSRLHQEILTYRLELGI